MRLHDYDKRKFSELLLLLAKKCADDPGFGATKLHKLLFHCEFRAYRELGRAITGVPFQNLENGPAAKPLLPVQGELVGAGDARIGLEPTTAGVQRRLMALREPDVSDFSPAELELIDTVVKELWRKTATQVSVESHREPGWLVTSEREAIPYHMALLSRPDADDDDERVGREILGSAALPRRT